MTKKTILVALAGILFIAVSGCAVGSGGTDGLDSIVDPSGTTPIEGGWFTDDDPADDGNVIGDPIEDPTPPADATPPPDDRGDECSDLNHDFDVVNKEYFVEDEVELVINAFGGSGNFDWRVRYLPSGLDWEKSSDTNNVTITGTLNAVETRTVEVRLKDIGCPDRGWVIKTFEIKSALNPENVKVHNPTSGEVGTITDCSAPAVTLRIDGAGVRHMESLILNAEVMRKVSVFKGSSLEITPVINGGEDRYTTAIEGLRGKTVMDGCPAGQSCDEDEADEVTNNETREFVTGFELGEKDVTVTVNDNDCAISHEYHFTVDVTCRIARLDDVYIKMRAAYNKTRDDAFCNYTKAGFALVNTTHYTGSDIKKSAESGSSITQFMDGTVTLDTDGGLTLGSSAPLAYDGWFYLSRDGDKEKIDDRPKVIEFDDDDRMDGMCLEDIDGVGFLLGDEGCTGKPSLKVRTVEVKACLKELDGEAIDERDTYSNTAWDFGYHYGCYFATYQHGDDESGRDSFGFRNLDQGKWGYQTRSFDDPESGVRWYDERNLDRNHCDLFGDQCDLNSSD